MSDKPKHSIMLSCTDCKDNFVLLEGSDDLEFIEDSCILIYHEDDILAVCGKCFDKNPMFKPLVVALRTKKKANTGDSDNAEHSDQTSNN